MGKFLHGTSIALPAPLVANSCDPVDARLVVETKADLTNPETFGTIIDGIYCKVYYGMLVYVKADKALYMFTGKGDNSGIFTSSVTDMTEATLNNWQKVLDSRGFSDSNSIIDKSTTEIPQLEVKLKTYGNTPEDAKKQLLEIATGVTGGLSIKDDAIWNCGTF